VTVDGRKLMRIVALAAWAAFFDYLWLSGAALRYVGSRTHWVVPFGAIVLTLVALLQLAGLRRHGGTAVRRTEIAGLLMLIAPVIAILLIPSPVLGSLAVRNKASARDLAAMSAQLKATGGPLTVYDIAVASQYPDFAARRGVMAGLPVGMSGVVSATRQGGFDLSRFKVYCCAADAIPFTVKIESTQAFKNDDWVAVKGRLEDAGDGTFIVRATSAHTASIDNDPYL
jgi:uncharacterized repeat protein (TIGR03943 family)